MTKLGLAPGVALPASQRRLAPGYMQPTIVNDGVVGATSLHATASAVCAVAHTKGSWAQVIAATTSDITYLMLSLTSSTFVAATDTSMLLDIGIGAAASEVVIVPNLAVGYQTLNNSNLYEIPVYIPAGSRVAIRCQCAFAASVSVQFVFAQLPHGRRPPSTIVDIGTDLATSHGVGLSTPAGNNTKGAWTQITAATTEPYEALIIGAQGNADTAFGTSGGALLDIGYGASGSEVVLAPDLPLVTSTAEVITWGLTPLIPCRLPKGTRLACRYQTVNTATSLDVILYGVRP